MAPNPHDDELPADPSSVFGSAWDEYAQRAAPDGHEWPGDEWGDPELWTLWFERLLGGASDWRRAVEIGQGTGKYTSRVLDAGTSEVLALDVSKVFLDLCAERLASQVEAGRLQLRQIHEKDGRTIQNAVRAARWDGSVDALFAIDALVHVPFTQIVSILIAGTEILRPGGSVAFTFACATSDAGFEKLITDLDRDLRSGLNPTSGTFHWVCPELVGGTAERLGYRIEFCDVDPAHHRDGHFRAVFEDPDRAAAVRARRAASTVTAQATD